MVVCGLSGLSVNWLDKKINIFLVAFVVLFVCRAQVSGWVDFLLSLFGYLVQVALLYKLLLSIIAILHIRDVESLSSDMNYMDT